MLFFVLAISIATAGGNSQNSSAADSLDPGPRSGPAAAGGPRDGLSSDYMSMFTASRAVFQEVDSVTGSIAGETGKGLGPGFNSNSCASCHAQPDVGGSSPAVNPQFSLASLDMASNQLPEFILVNGPVREARFVQNPDGTPDGGVHDLFTIAGRTDAQGCVDPQPDFATALAQNNVIFRIPTPVFGAGLVEDISDTSILNNAAANAHAKSQMGISGRPNRSGNDGSITRFGWKAQNKSLLIFAGEAYNVEQGVTNEAFPNERDLTPSCQFGPKAEDDTNLTTDTSTFAPSGLLFRRGELRHVHAALRSSHSGAANRANTGGSPGLQQHRLCPLPYAVDQHRHNLLHHPTIQRAGQRFLRFPHSQYGLRSG